MTNAPGEAVQTNLDARTQALRACAAQWQDPNSDVRRAARAALSDGEWPPRVVEAALDNVLRGAESVLTSWSQAAGGQPQNCPAPLQRVLAIMPANVIGPTLATAFCAAAAGATIMLKSSSRELRLAEIVAEQFQSAGAPLNQTVTPMRWTGGDEDFEAKIFRRASRIIAFGDDATIADIRRRTPTHVSLVGYGSAYSLGFIPAGTDIGLAASAAADDVALFDQRGCLSPQTIYVEGPESKALMFAHALAKALEHAAQDLPRARAGEAEQAAVADFIRRLLVRALPPGTHSLDSVIIGRRSAGVPDYVVGVENFSRPVCAGFGRIVVVMPCASVADAALAAKTLEQRLDTVGIGGTVSAALEDTFYRCGAGRVCRLGEMQRPPLGYRPKIEDFLADSA
jgi:acyl-CoA reductase-like NAD-dependent aldehyde dehydrogenase